MTSFARLKHSKAFPMAQHRSREPLGQLKFLKTAITGQRSCSFGKRSTADSVNQHGFKSTLVLFLVLLKCQPKFILMNIQFVTIAQGTQHIIGLNHCRYDRSILALCVLGNGPSVSNTRFIRSLIHPFCHKKLGHLAGLSLIVCNNIEVVFLTSTSCQYLMVAGAQHSLSCCSTDDRCNKSANLHGYCGWAFTLPAGAM